MPKIEVIPQPDSKGIACDMDHAKLREAKYHIFGGKNGFGLCDECFEELRVAMNEAAIRIGK